MMINRHSLSPRLCSWPVSCLLNHFCLIGAVTRLDKQYAIHENRFAMPAIALPACSLLWPMEQSTNAGHRPFEEAFA
jgi:hypothetical protein